MYGGMAMLGLSSIPTLLSGVPGLTPLSWFGLVSFGAAGRNVLNSTISGFRYHKKVLAKVEDCCCTGDWRNGGRSTILHNTGQTYSY